MTHTHNPSHSGKLLTVGVAARPHDIYPVGDLSSPKPETKPKKMDAPQHPMVQGKYAVLPARDEIITSEHVQQLTARNGI